MADSRNPKLGDLLDERLIAVPFEAADKWTAITALVDLIAQAGEVLDADQARERVLERESVMTTGVGQGIALPHATLPGLDGLRAALGIAPGGVEFEASDGHPARILVLLLASQAGRGLHVRLLSRVSRLLASEDVRRALISARDAAEALEIVRVAESAFES
jgi:mannitol/fructose-specific phosphotransferase system IIA component (Ntr-type)